MLSAAPLTAPLLSIWLQPHPLKLRTTVCLQTRPMIAGSQIRNLPALVLPRNLKRTAAYQKTITSFSNPRVYPVILRKCRLKPFLAINKILVRRIAGVAVFESCRISIYRFRWSHPHFEAPPPKRIDKFFFRRSSMSETFNFLLEIQIPCKWMIASQERRTHQQNAG